MERPKAILETGPLFERVREALAERRIAQLAGAIEAHERRAGDHAAAHDRALYRRLRQLTGSGVRG